MAGAFKWHSCSTKDFPLKRNKVTKACNACRTKKMRCDGKPRCVRCTDHSLLCHYDEKTRRSSPSKKPNLLKRDLHTATVEQTIKNITFSNHYYTRLLARQSSRPFIYLTRLPPLLFGFFDISSQPHIVWVTFLDLFTQYLQASPNQPGFSRLAKELAAEMVSLFTTYNLLYSPFLETPLIDMVISNLQNPFDLSVAPPKGVEIVLTFSVFALTFQAAHQALSSKYPKLSLDLERFAHLFYTEAHKRLLAAAFPSQPLAASQDSLIVLIQSAILLTHYQCTTVCEEQAFITLQIGATFAQRCSFPNVPKQKPDVVEKQRNLLLFKLLHSWDVWFGVYLHRSCWTNQVLDQIESPEQKMLSINDFTNDQQGYQQWAMFALEQYTGFLSQLTKDLQVDRIKAQLGTLGKLSNLSNVKQPNDSKFDDICAMKLSVAALGIFHQVLTIQLFNCQLEASFEHYPEGPIDLVALGLCVSAANCIVQSSKVLASNSNTSPIIIYALCVAARVFDLKNQEQNIQNKRSKYPPLGTRQLPKKPSQSEVSPSSNESSSNEPSAVHEQLLQVIKTLSAYSDVASTLEMYINPKPSFDFIVHTSSERNGEKLDPLPVSPTIPLYTDDSLHNFVPAQPRSINQSSLGYPMLDVMSRADMDREQLSKLSHTSSIEREDPASVRLYSSGPLQANLNKDPQMSKQNENTNRPARVPKRQRPPIMNNDLFSHHQWQETQAHYPHKRTRANNLGNNDQEMTGSVGTHGQNQQQQQQQKEKTDHDQKQERRQYLQERQQERQQEHEGQQQERHQQELQAQQEQEQEQEQQQEQQTLSFLSSFERGLGGHNVNHQNPYLNIQEVHEDSSGGLGIYHDDYMWIGLPINDPLQTEQTQNHHQHFYPSVQTVKNRPNRPSEVSPTPELPAMSSTNTTPGSGTHTMVFENIASEVVGLENSGNPPKLPLPPPKQRDTPPKHWASSHSRDWNECFTASVVETLHQNTSVTAHEPSFGTPIVQSIGLDNLSTHHEHPSSLVPQTSTHPPGITDEENTEMIYILYSSSQPGPCGERSSVGSSNTSGESLVCQPSTNWLSNFKHTSQTSALPGEIPHQNTIRQPLDTQQYKHAPKTFISSKAPEYRKKSNREFTMISTNSMAPNPVYTFPINISPTSDLRSVGLQSRYTTSSNSSCQNTDDGPDIFSQENPWIEISQAKMPGDVLSWH
ncbi:hypothetical protein CLU79DRAFT_733410 [Phycomyces nitens]|nr:hypothetical protein CLU79DRAFT_733410 [Phycomyces nitens]